MKEEDVNEQEQPNEVVLNNGNDHEDDDRRPDPFIPKSGPTTDGSQYLIQNPNENTGIK